MQATERRLVILLVLMFLGYAFVRLMTNQSAQENPRELVDTAAYFRVSQQPITDVRFWGDKRPLVFPLLLKISAGDFPRASLYQVVFSIFAWGLLACFVSASMRTVRLRLASFGLILALSLVRHLANWEYVMMTESLSVSWFVLFLALGIWLVHGWRADKVIALCEEEHERLSPAHAGRDADSRCAIPLGQAACVDSRRIFFVHLFAQQLQFRYRRALGLSDAQSCRAAHFAQFGGSDLS